MGLCGNDCMGTFIIMSGTLTNDYPATSTQEHVMRALLEGLKGVLSSLTGHATLGVTTYGRRQKMRRPPGTTEAGPTRGQGT